MKLKTMEELEIVDAYEFDGENEVLKEIKQAAIKWLLYALKKRKNPYKAFMDFHNIKDEDLIELKGGKA